MNTPFFTGEYRKKPVQSLGGASKSETKNDLLEKNRRQRMLREHRRQEEEAATRIQAFYRGSHSRKLTHRLTRERFDQEIALTAASNDGACSPDQFLLLAKCLNNFYLPHLDGERIAQLCSLYVRHHSVLWPSFRSSIPSSSHDEEPQLCAQGTYALGKLLSNALSHLASLGAGSESREYTSALRAVELAIADDGSGSSMALRQYLTGKGFYRCLAAFLTVKCGPSAEDAYGRPLVRALCQLLLSPLHGGCGGRAEALELLTQTGDCEPLVACHVIGRAIAGAATADPSVGAALLEAAAAAAADWAQAGTCGLLHLLACRGRELATSVSGDRATGGRQLLAGLHSCRWALARMPTALAAEVVDGLGSDWFSELARAALMAGPPAETYAHLASVCEMCPSLSLYSLTPAGQPRRSFLSNFWRAVAEFRHPPSPSLASSPLVDAISRASQPPPAAALVALQPMLSAFSRLFRPDSYPRSQLSALSGQLRDLLLGLLLLSHPDTRPDLLNADYVRALKYLGGDAPSSAAGAAGSQQSSSQDLLHLYSSLFTCVKSLVDQLFTADQLRTFTRSEAAAVTSDTSASSHWSVQGRIPPIRSLQPAYWLERDPGPSSRQFGYYSVLNDAVSIPYLSSTERLQLAILTEAPYLIGFWDRVRLLYSLLHAYKSAIDYDRHEFGSGGIRVTARRDRIYEDAFSQLYGEENLYPRIRVTFKNEHGLEEAGIDGGGLMREFLALVLSSAFDPVRGFYCQTGAGGSGGSLYPNPVSCLINSDHCAHYFFHGKLLGKLIFERLLIDLPLAPFFLRRVIIYASGDWDAERRAAACVEELEQFDAHLYKNVSSLSQASPEDLEAMELDFTVSEDRLGQSETVVLKPDGGSLRVTQDNASEYQQLLADHKLHRRIAQQTRAFAQGLVSVIPCSDWLAFFSHSELQLLISGSDSPLDVIDLRRHTSYQGCASDSETVLAFWRLMLDEFTEPQRRCVLRFATSLTRAPLYGWGELQPPFTLSLVPETQRLPSASTCVNLLKLPDYKDQQVLKRNLLLAAESNSGFELS